MHYNVQIFTWTPRQGVHQVGSAIEVDAPNSKAAAVSLLGLRLENQGCATKLAVRVWHDDAYRAECDCYYYNS
ncbi:MULTISPECIES: hypothetical protein [Sinorhizobium/Ensifer group]|jgi:hypothetical protein|uniref:hypothetical protein n=1 Tax=Sinorhizobium/Ensifer group TaxID=227292 RepID=UPI000709BBCD|nr:MULTISPECIES: hypothetical protein [Sinorhizobium/Ensifer group]KRD49006.1 hypothetical protein ASE60_20840 [Ensifer sp. Root278]KSV69889.1 hypothetical protein N183_04495 [Sinorhizobium sp. Sb3]KSV92132.1 hypothetical protein N184_24040 [Sinorhizobium sp. GL28]MBD9509928.1 hypothetical protein [Ensifer sp. ENS10]MBV7522072.1 hypothetical protein [Ensifer sp. ENS12]